MKLGSIYVDFHQGTKDSYQHSMAEAGQNALAQQAGTKEYVEDMTGAAKVSELSGHHSMAMFELGAAMHPVMDATSPTHTDASGKPRVWNPSEVAAHRKGESGQPTAAQMKQMGDKMREMYNQVVTRQ